MPEFGTPDAAAKAIEFVGEALGRRRPAGTAVESVNAELDNELADIVVALVQMSASMVLLSVGLLQRRGIEITPEGLLKHLADDQQVHAARHLLDGLDGNPFDA
ncbi:hypothetical protein [uncultured Jatrophihabitans sp.]|uniref:hypothetical protein n=1 Tax=uncultured Jatrophihabitans sp. TaxID=1610747 RepID=UPI0035C99902